MLNSRFHSFTGATAAASLVMAAACSDVTSPPSLQQNPAESVTQALHDDGVFVDRLELRPESGRVNATQAVFGTGDVHRRFSSIDRVCLRFIFSDWDLFDPGEELEMFVDGPQTGGFINVGSEPQTARTLCWVRRFHPEILARFLDGKANFRFEAEHGSFKFRWVNLRIAGTPR